MNELKWSRDLKEIVVAKETLTAEEALDILTRELLGSDYCIVDPVGVEQGNAIIVRDILKQYHPKRKRLF